MPPFGAEIVAAGARSDAGLTRGVRRVLFLGCEDLDGAYAYLSAQGVNAGRLYRLEAMA